MSEAVCCVCLSGDLKTKGIDDRDLLNIFEKLTDLKLCGEMCAPCLVQLRRCERFAESAKHAHSLLTRVARGGLQVTKETLSALKVQPVLSVSKISLHYIGLQYTVIKDEVSVKIEEDISATNIGEDEDISATNIGEDIMKEDNVNEDTKQDIEETVKNIRIKKSKKTAKLIKDAKRVRKKETHMCEFCKKEFKRKNEMVVHRRTHTGERPFVCDECPKAFISASNLKYHKISHVPIADRPRIHTCQQCGSTFSHKMHLRLHLQIHSEKKYACELCGKSFSMPTRLKNHMRTHSNERLHSCDRCAKSFKTPGVLKDHMLSHSNTKPHACSECDKTFARKHELSLHKRVHTGEKPYSCHVCGKAFSQSGSLRTHTITHSEERPFACEICGSKFKDKYTRSKHLATHASGPPCVCAVCGRHYSSRRGATAHARAHSRDVSAPCGQCGKTFSNIAHLRRHQRNVRCAREAGDGDC